MDYTRAKTDFSLSPIYSARKSSNHKFSKNHKNSPDTNLHKTYTNIRLKFFEQLVPSVLPLLKKQQQQQKHIEPRQASIMDHSVDLSIPDVKTA